MNHYSPQSLARKVSTDTYRSNGSANTHASQSSKKLLFGEIPTPSSAGSRSLHSNTSLCSLVMSNSPAFLRFWLSDDCRQRFLSHLNRPELSALRLVCHDCSSRVAPFLFEQISITFKPSSFSKTTRTEALERIGHHVRTLTFRMPRTPATFLPPVIDPVTGEQLCLDYEPHIPNSAAASGRGKQPKYGTWELTDLLVKQYPPIFHAATNVPAFIRTLTAMPFMSHMKIDCPNQDAAPYTGRTAVDYALISLRMAVERAPLQDLDTLTLMAMHPAGLLYLRPNMGPGSTPASTKRWSQIRVLAMFLDSIPSSGLSHAEHMRILNSYLRQFAHGVTKFHFRWLGEKGPSPLSHCGESSTRPHHHHGGSRKSRHGPRTLRFARLQDMELENAVMDATQISAFIERHRRTLVDFNFEAITLRSGTWDDALAPLTKMTGNEAWKQRGGSGGEQQQEFMDVPIVLSPVGLRPEQLAAAGTQGVRLTKIERWLGANKTAARAKEQIRGCEEHMRKFLRGAAFPWR
ncbi:hypothetical protein IWX49DRAFT_569257 [Phyllosticta citricarpa]|uniref:Uncharacterized protein n=2 Tax=Phyllosticta TaxID=121621 RepID=A0ABR1MPF9_9PEZI